MALEAIDLNPITGSEIEVSKDELLSGVHRMAIRSLLQERGVVVFRDLELTDEEQRGIACQLGELHPDDISRYGDKGMIKLTLNPDVNPELREIAQVTMLWHLDRSNEEVPPSMALLRPVHIAEEGGQTEFVNNYATYEALDPADRAHLDTLKCVHTRVAAMLRAMPHATFEQVRDWMSAPGRVHPLVWAHKSGRRSLALSATCSHILGMDPGDSYDLLTRLMAHATQPRFVYRHQWRPNDLLIWDNTCTMHRARPYALDSNRLMHRFVLKGEEPITAVVS